MTAAMTRNAISALKNSPYRNLLLLIVKERLAKSGLPPIAAISGVTRSFTNAVTTTPNAVPMTTATARSTTLPLSKKVRKPFKVIPPWLIRHRQDDLAELLGRVKTRQCRLHV